MRRLPVQGSAGLCHVSAPISSPVGVTSKRQASEPSSTLSAMIPPRIPSRPRLADEYRPFHTSGAARCLAMDQSGNPRSRALSGLGIQGVDESVLRAAYPCRRPAPRPCWSRSSPGPRAMC